MRHGHLAFEICTDKKPDFYHFSPAPKRQTTAQVAMEWGPKLLARRLKRLFAKPS